MQNAERAIGARELSSLNVGSAYVLTVQRGHVLDSIRALKSHPAVRYAEPDYLAQLAAVPNDPSFPIQWAYRNTGQFVNGTSLKNSPGRRRDRPAPIGGASNRGAGGAMIR